MFHCQKTKGFVPFSEGIKMEVWPKIGSISVSKNGTLYSVED